jgi:hypothetical protein
MSNARPSQAKLILDELQSRQGEWTPMPVLSLLSGAYAVHSRIAELRSMGFTIDHRNEKHGRVIKSFYRLVGSSC